MHQFGPNCPGNSIALAFVWVAIQGDTESRQHQYHSELFGTTQNRSGPATLGNINQY